VKGRLERCMLILVSIGFDLFCRHGWIDGNL
jgi:hypothetical protein